MSKHNFVAKNMHLCNKSSVHIDRKKQGVSKEADINQGIYDFLDSFDKYQQETYGDTWTKAKEIVAKTPLNPRLSDKVSISKEQLKEIGLRSLYSYATSDPSEHKCYLDLSNEKNKVIYYNAFINIKNILVEKKNKE